jgi:hypothetical protein
MGLCDPNDTLIRFSLYQRIRRYPIQTNYTGRCHLYTWGLISETGGVEFWSKLRHLTHDMRQELGGQLMQRQVNYLHFVNAQYISETSISRYIVENPHSLLYKKAA